jgi:hypothetical protein
MNDFANYSNAQFDAVRLERQPHGFLRNQTGFNNARLADYNTTVNSWLEQRLYVTDAPRLLAKEQPELAASLDTALQDLQHVRVPSPAGMTRVAKPTSAVFECGGLTVGFDDHGALSQLTSANGVEWANGTHPVGLYRYQTFTNEDYNVFLQDFASRAPSTHKDCMLTPGAPDDPHGCANFRKPNVSAANPVHRELVPTLTALWHETGTRGTGSSSDSATGAGASTGGCRFLAQLTMVASAHRMAGAPEKLVVVVEVAESAGSDGVAPTSKASVDDGLNGNMVTWDVVQINKRPTRLPEAGFFSFTPAVAAAHPTGWRLEVLGSSMDPTDVLGSGPGGYDHNHTVYGGSPHLRGVAAVTWTGAQKSHGGSAAAEAPAPSFKLASADVPIVSTGVASPFISPRNGPPDMRGGVHYNIFQNLWNTNYVLW